VAYRPPAAPSDELPSAPVAPWAPPAHDAAELVIPPPPVWTPRAEPPPPKLTTPPPPPQSEPSEAPAELLDEVRRRADVGDFKGAELKCRQALQERPEDSALHFYAGLVEQALGRLGPAEDALRRAAYLDPAFIMAHYHLGLIRMARGRAEAGRKAVAAAAQMAGTLAVDERLREGAGLTAGELRELARVQLDTSAGGA
jgi:chemotaxis protein methyltransferase CheR